MFLAVCQACVDHRLPMYESLVQRRSLFAVDTEGHILNAHDGSVQFFNGTYFLYGTVYENCTQVRLGFFVVNGRPL